MYVLKPRNIEATPGIVPNIRSGATRAHMPIVSLREFLGCVRFGFVSLGVDRRAIENTFGQPEDVDTDSVKRRHAPAIMKYGDVEFHLRPDTGLWVIHIDRFSGPGRVPVGWGGCQIDPWVIKEGMPRAGLERELKRAALPYVLKPRPEFHQERLVLSSGVQVGFTIDEDEPHGLEFVSFCPTSNL
jgi:hypothetical protein